MSHLQQRFSYCAIALFLTLTGAVCTRRQTTASDFLSRGDGEFIRRDFDAAIADYTHAIELDPKYTVAYRNRGVAMQSKGNLDGAIADYTHAIELDPKDVWAYTNRGVVKKSKGDLDGAIADFTRAIEIDPRAEKAYTNRGVAKGSKGDYDGAIADCTHAIELDPNNASAYNNRGIAKKSKGDLNGAIADFTIAIKLDPKHASAYFNRGVAEKSKGNLDGAIVDFTRAIELDPKVGHPAKGLAHIYFIQQRWTDSLTEFRRGLEFNGNDQDYPHIYIWLIRSRLGEGQAAGEELNAYFEKRAGTKAADWPSQIAKFLVDKGTETDLLAAAGSNIPKTDSGQHCEAWFYIGMKHLLAGDKAAAREAFNKCIATGEKTYVEYAFAQAELKALDK